MNGFIAAFLVAIGFILGFVVCMHDFDRRFQEQLKELKRSDNGCGKEDE
jgi:hypothetical protein